MDKKDVRLTEFRMRCGRRVQVILEPGRWVTFRTARPSALWARLRLGDLQRLSVWLDGGRIDGAFAAVGSGLVLFENQFRPGYLKGKVRDCYDTCPGWSTIGWSVGARALAGAVRRALAAIKKRGEGRR